VPGACWRPYHSAEWLKDEVRLRSDACVWQNTGEDWTNCTLILSTERSSLGVEPPYLATDTVHAQRTSTMIVAQSREQKVFVTGKGSTGPKPDGPLGIDDGGETLELRARSRATIPSDGRPYRVLFEEFSSPYQASLFCAPELSSLVHRRTVQTNRSTLPLLAGPVDLIREGGLIGRTRCLFVAPNERFELGFGPDPELLVTRECVALETKQPLLGAYTHTTHQVRIHLRNLGDSPKRIEMVERICVSEIEKLVFELEPELTSPKARADERGFVTWYLDLGAFDTLEVKLGYVVKRHSDVVGM
jgi:uncharacterized protein (TIGR02231 family)